MQALYAREMNRDLTLQFLQNQMQSSITKAVSLYLTNLLYLVEVCRYSMVDKAKRLSKFIQTEEDKNASTTIAANRIIRYLEDNAGFNSLVKSSNVNHFVQEDIVKNIFTILAGKQKYKEYAATAEPTLQQDKEIISYILKKIFEDNAELAQYLDEHFLNFHDDEDLLLFILSKYADSFKEEDQTSFVASIKIWDEEQKFAHELLKKCYEYDEEILELIKPNLRNWDMERVAVMDMILMKMAVCELKYFPTVPVKVSINEYIDISKLYSTPKSKDFVNGVLDKVKFQLIESGEIKKFGRGLME